MRTVEYRVRPVTRYVVTRYQTDTEGACGCEAMGEFDNEVKASNAVLAFGDSETIDAQPADVVITNRPNTPPGFEQRREWRYGIGWGDNPEAS